MAHAQYPGGHEAKGAHICPSHVAHGSALSMHGLEWEAEGGIGRTGKTCANENNYSRVVSCPCIFCLYRPIFSLNRLKALQTGTYVCENTHFDT